MTSHPLQPIHRRILFPLLVTAGAVSVSLLMTFLHGGAVLEHFSIAGTVALSAALPICVWHRGWFGALTSPVLAGTGLALVLSFKYGADVSTGVRLLFRQFRGLSSLVLLAAAWSLLHAAFFRRITKAGMRSLIWPSDYILVALIAVAACAWHGILLRPVDWALLGLIQFAAARIAVARARTDVGTPPGADPDPHR